MPSGPRPGAGPNFISSYEHATLVPGQDCALLVARLRQAARHRRSTLPARRLRLLARGGLHPARQMLALPARRTPLLDAASCRDWPHCVLGASPACPSGPAAGAARALGPGPPGLKFELSLSFHGHSQNASATFPVVASATFPMVTKGIGSYKQQDGGHRSRGRQRERPPRDL